MAIPLSTANTSLPSRTRAHSQRCHTFKVPRCIYHRAIPLKAAHIHVNWSVHSRSQRCAVVALSSRQQDVGHWDLSPEWFGTQGGGWGRDAGMIVFQEQSHLGNGQVVVTAHPASPVASSGFTSREEWRVLRFNDLTRQSVARVRLLDGAADPRCLAFEYTKAIAAAVASVVGVAGMQHWVRRDQLPGSRNGRAVCVGMGGGSLPLFLSHHYPQLQVEAVDIDPVVISAAQQAMGFPSGRPNLAVREVDAAAYIAELAAGSCGEVDIAVLDLFDGDDMTPAFLSAPGFLANLGAAMHPDHGTVILNLHGGGAGGFSLLRLLGREDGPGFETNSPVGAAVAELASTFKRALLKPRVEGGLASGVAYTLSVASQQNIIVVVTRMMKPGALSGLQHYETAKRLQDAADAVAAAAGYVFSTTTRASRGFRPAA